jgi:putative ABC transport system substrate-binding protein
LPTLVFPGDEAFVRRLAQAGYHVGRDVHIDSSGTGVGMERVHDRAARLVEHRAAIIVTVGTLPTEAARQATRTTPIVMLAAEDPVEEGLVASLGRPGGNVTGVAIPSRQLLGVTIPPALLARADHVVE